MASVSSGSADPVGGELARVMRTVTWFLPSPLILPVASLVQGKPLPARFDAIWVTIWVVGAAAFYLGFRGRSRDPQAWAAAAAFAVLAIIALLRLGAAPQALPLVPFAGSVLAVLLGSSKALAPSDDEERIDPGHPLATVALLEKHAAELEGAGRASEAKKLRERIEKVRAKASDG